MRSVVGDKYAGETFRADFQGKGISYRVSEFTKSEIYEEIEPLLNGGRIVLLDHPNLESQFLGLVWRGGKIDHPNGEHDDYANGAAGALNLASKNIARTLGGTLKQAKSFREIDDEPPAKSLIAIDSGTTKLSKSEY